MCGGAAPPTGASKALSRPLKRPWQALARCFELAEAWSCQQPEDFVSYVPVHMDGSCNGLQSGNAETSSRSIYKHVHIVYV